MSDYRYRPEVEILSVTDTGRRRRWTDEEKLRIVEESLGGRGRVAEIARCHDIGRTLLVRWRRQYREGRLGVTNEDCPRFIADIQAWIADNYAADNPVQEMTRRSGLPATTFARRFRNATGQSPQDYVLTMRVEEAKQILETSEDGVDSVGRAVGYADPASFKAGKFRPGARALAAL